MSNFERGLDGAFVTALNEEYEKGGWWQRFVNDEDIFIAIRKNRVNAYYRGCSLLKLDWKAGAIVGEVHYKYLLRPSLAKPYLKVKDGEVHLPDDPKQLFQHSIDDIGDLKRAAQPYAGEEKTGVHDILRSNHNILDVEIAFGADESDPSVSRLDFAAITEAGDGTNIVFYEVKHFDNKELRASDKAKPKVVQQIETYSGRLTKNHDQVRASYRLVCCNLRSLHGMRDRNPQRHAMIEAIADGSRELLLDNDPVLIVFGFDADQRVGKNWEPHRETLEAKLGRRVFFKGDSKQFVRGISV